MEKGNINMDKMIDIAMTRLFQLAEYVCSKCSSVLNEPAVSQEVAPTIRFTNEDKMVEGELFK